MGPLEGICVLDFTQMMAGPVCAMLLGDLGADVIKIEPPEGDAIRRTGETFLGGETESFLSFNRNKRSVVIDLKAEAGREAGRGLAAGADVVLENFRPGAAERLGVGYEVLRALNPRLVYCSTKFWHALIAALDAPELGADPRFLSNADRVRNRTALNAWLAVAFRTASLDEWTPRLTAAGVLFAPVRSLPEVFSDPRVRREMLVELDHPTAGRITVLANPLRFSETPATVRRCPPRLGEHTAEVLPPEADEAGGAAS